MEGVSLVLKNGLITVCASNGEQYQLKECIIDGFHVKAEVLRAHLMRIDPKTDTKPDPETDTKTDPETQKKEEFRKKMLCGGSIFGKQLTVDCNYLKKHLKELFKMEILEMRDPLFGLQNNVLMVLKKFAKEPSRFPKQYTVKIHLLPFQEAASEEAHKAFEEQRVTLDQVFAGTAKEQLASYEEFFLAVAYMYLMGMKWNDIISISVGSGCLVRFYLTGGERPNTFYQIKAVAHCRDEHDVVERNIGPNEAKRPEYTVPVTIVDAAW